MSKLAKAIKTDVCSSSAMDEIAEGAEAKIFLDSENSRVLKERVKKCYRIPEIDIPLRRYRTRREAKVFDALNGKLPIPDIISCSEDDMKIEMSFVKGKKLRDVLCRENAELLCGVVGEQIGVVHSSGIVHGDLTTSNMILGEDKKIYFIDFGLSFFSIKAEDRAVDLHLLRQALESRHHSIWRECFDCAVQGYKKAFSGADDVLRRLESVESRGRYKGKH